MCRHNSSRVAGACRELAKRLLISDVAFGTATTMSFSDETNTVLFMKTVAVISLLQKCAALSVTISRS